MLALAPQSDFTFLQLAREPGNSATRRRRAIFSTKSRTAGPTRLKERLAHAGQSVIAAAATPRVASTQRFASMEIRQTGNPIPSPRRRGLFFTRLQNFRECAAHRLELPSLPEPIQVVLHVLALGFRRQRDTPVTRTRAPLADLPPVFPRAKGRDLAYASLHRATRQLRVDARTQEQEFLPCSRAGAQRDSPAASDTAPKSPSSKAGSFPSRCP